MSLDYQTDMELQLTAKMYVVNSELLNNMLRFSNDKERPRRATFLKWEIITFNLIKSFLLNQIQKHLEICNIVNYTSCRKIENVPHTPML